MAVGLSVAEIDGDFLAVALLSFRHAEGGVEVGEPIGWWEVRGSGCSDEIQGKKQGVRRECASSGMWLRSGLGGGADTER